MTYRNRTTLQGSVPADTSDTPGGGVGCRFVTYENATAENLNRPHYALAENTDHLYARDEFVVCGPSAADGVDYSGASAVEDALTAGEKKILVLDGTYTFSASVTLSAEGTVIRGESESGVTLDFSGGSYSLNLGADNVTLENLTLSFSSGYGISASSVGDGSIIRRCTVNGNLVLTNVNNIQIVDSSFTASGSKTFSFSNASALCEFVSVSCSGSQALYLSGGNYQFYDCTFSADGQVAVTTAIIAFFLNCGFVDISTSDYYTNFAEIEGDTVVMEGCEFDIVNCNRTTPVDPYVSLSGVNGRNITINVSNQWRADDYLLELLFCEIDSLAVNVPSGHVAVGGTPVEGAIKVGQDTIVKNIGFVNIDGAWPCSLLYTGGTREQRAVVDGVMVVPGSAWYFEGGELLATVSGFSTIRGVRWNDIKLGMGASPSRSIIGRSSISEQSGIVIEDCDIRINTTSYAGLQYIVYFKTDAGLNGNPGIKIRNSSFKVTPQQTSGSAPDYFDYVIYVAGNTSPSNTYDQTQGNQYGQITNCDIYLDAEIIGSAASHKPEDAPIALDSSCVGWRIDNCKLSGNLNSSGDDGYNVLLYAARSSTPSPFGNQRGGANLPTSNILSNLASTSTVPYVASPDGLGDAGFCDGVTNLLNIQVRG